MATTKPKPLFYVVIKDVKTRPKYKTRNITVYKNGIPTTLNTFAKWLKETINKEAIKK